jgi:hypothetical protein
MNDTPKGTEGAKPKLEAAAKPAAAAKVEAATKAEAVTKAEANIQAETTLEPVAKTETQAPVDPVSMAAIASQPVATETRPALEPVHADEEKQDQGRWTRWLVWFLRAMAVMSMAKGLYHWSFVLGIGEGPDTTFTTQSLPWQSATVYFAIIDLVAAVGLWLAAVWGAVVWLTAGVSMAAVEVFFPQIYGGSWLIVAIELFLLCCYLVLALQSAREHPH